MQISLFEKTREDLYTTILSGLKLVQNRAQKTFTSVDICKLLRIRGQNLNYFLKRSEFY